MPRLTIRIDFEEQGSFGPGKARLLELIEAEGSIRRAATAMEMSYRQAWLLLRDAEAVIGAPLIVTATGGAKGGGTKLSGIGHDVVARYRRIEQTASHAVRSDIEALTGLAAKKKAAPMNGAARYA
ncbi:MAG TPA: LysR family transcriptional regulator [Rhizomicrobium sp.]|jgi:molybdate transport system regulatory protein|nr:LysR family transcriptional regulator [Rhizomicrobium sp.]